MEVRNRYKGLDLIDRVPDKLWNEVRDIVQETGIKTIPMEKKCKKVKPYQQWDDSAVKLNLKQYNKFYTLNTSSTY